MNIGFVSIMIGAALLAIALVILFWRRMLTRASAFAPAESMRLFALMKRKGVLPSHTELIAIDSAIDWNGRRINFKLRSPDGVNWYCKTGDREYVDWSEVIPPEAVHLIPSLVAIVKHIEANGPIDLENPTEADTEVIRSVARLARQRR